MVYAVRVIPVNPEIGSGRFQPCKTANGLIRIGIACRVGIFRHAPDTLDALIFGYKLFNYIHIRSFFGHRYIDHLDAEILGDGKMSVITRYRTQEFNLV